MAVSARMTVNQSDYARPGFRVLASFFLGRHNHAQPLRIIIITAMEPMKYLRKVMTIAVLWLKSVGWMMALG